MGVFLTEVEAKGALWDHRNSKLREVVNQRPIPENFLYKAQNANTPQAGLVAEVLRPLPAR